MSETYPGSVTPLRSSYQTVMSSQQPDPTAWDAHPVLLRLGGMDREFFTVGALGSALQRSPNTLREWETNGMLPKARWRSTAQEERGRRRLYSRAQVEGLREIAEQEGLIPPNSRVKVGSTHFPARAHQLFDELRKEDA